MGCVLMKCIRNRNFECCLKPNSPSFQALHAQHIWPLFTTRDEVWGFISILLGGLFHSRISFLLPNDVRSCGDASPSFLFYLPMVAQVPYLQFLVPRKGN